jgi:DNA topoisomerase-3
MTLLQSGLLLFYDDCSVANTTVIGKAADVAFKTTGKVILQKDGALFWDPNSKKKKRIYYPTLSKAKRTTPTLFRKGN